MAEAVWPRDGNPRPSGASSPEPWDSQSESSCCPFGQSLTSPLLSLWGHQALREPGLGAGPHTQHVHPHQQQAHSGTGACSEGPGRDGSFHAPTPMLFTFCRLLFPRTRAWSALKPRTPRLRLGKPPLHPSDSGRSPRARGGPRSAAAALPGTPAGVPGLEHNHAVAVPGGQRWLRDAQSVRCCLTLNPTKQAGASSRGLSPARPSPSTAVRSPGPSAS